MQPSPRNDKETAERVRNILTSNRYLTLATMNGQRPWAAPLAYVVEPGYSLVFYSARDSQHCSDFAHSRTVAIAVFDSTRLSDDADGVQIVATVSEVPEAELPRVMDHYFENSFPDPEIRKRWLRPIADFVSRSPQRFYRLTLDHVFTIDKTSTKVDRRIEVALSAIRALPA